MFFSKKKNECCLNSENNSNNNEKQEPLFIPEKKHYIMFGVFFSLFCLLLFLSSIPGDDYWWHIKVGEWIVQNKEIPKTGIFSWYAQENNLSWFAHEWLAEIVLYMLAYRNIIDNALSWI